MIGASISVLVALMRSVEKVLTKKVLHSEDALSFAVIFYLISSIFFVPFLFIDAFPTEIVAWLILAFAVLFWALTGYFSFLLFKHFEVSILVLVNKSKVLFSFILAIVILREDLTLIKLIGFGLILAGVIIVSYDHIKGKDVKSKWLLIAVLNSFFVAIALILDKYAMNYFSPGSYSFFVYFFPGLLLLPFILNKRIEIASLLKGNLRVFSVILILGALSYYLVLTAFKTSPASVVLPILELSTAFSIIFGIVFLKERERILQKILATIIVIIGAVLIALSA